MADKNKTPEEDYLDSLLRSITGGAEEEDDEEDFLADFEKEFLGDSEDELEPDFDALLEGDTKVKPQLENITITSEKPEQVKNHVEPQIQPVVQPEPEPIQSEPVQPELVQPESVPEEINEISANTQEGFADTEDIEDIEEIDIPDDMLFDIDSDILGAIDEAVTEDTKEVKNPFESEKAMVDEAIASEDSSVEDDLKGLYNILGMDGTSEELPEDIEDTPKKEKKGFFAKLKEKKAKKAEGEAKEDKVKKSKKKDKAANEEKLSKEADDIDFEAFFEQAETSDGDDFGDIDIASLDGGSASAGNDLGFDDDIFDNIDEGIGDDSRDDIGLADEDIFFDEEEKETKKKDKKEKKEKKKKEKKEKKEKAPKKKKPKKEKKPKAPDEIIYVPKVFIVFAISFVAVIILVAKIGGDYYNYNDKFYSAISLYVYGNDLEEGETLNQEKYETKFSEAYSMLAGLSMKEKDHETFYKQLETIMLMDTHYESYRRYMLIENFDNGLDSLIKAVKMYDKYQNVARDLKCFDEMTLVLSWVNKALESTYAITESQARDLSMIKDDDEYAVKVREIAAMARANYEKNNVEEE